MTAPETARDVLGVRVLPPGWASVWANRARAAVGRLHAAMAPPPVRVLEAALAPLDAAAIAALCDLGVPEALRAPTDVAALASAVDADPDHLERLVRYAAGRGWLRIDRHDRLRPTAALRFLDPAHPSGWRRWVDFAQRPEVVRAMYALGSSTRTGRPAFELANDTTFFEWTAAVADGGDAFDGAMAAGARMHALGLARAVDWSAIGTLCDVGGGTGALAASLVARHPHLEATVLDLPHVVAGCDGHERLRFVGGDAFDAVPPGQDAYLLVNVIHDWGDDDVVALLSTVRDAAQRGALVVVVDSERSPRPVDDLALRADLLMLALAPGGRERTTAETRDLAARAGLAHERSTVLASADRAHSFRRT